MFASLPPQTSTTGNRDQQDALSTPFYTLQATKAALPAVEENNHTSNTTKDNAPHEIEDKEVEVQRNEV